MAGPLDWPAQPPWRRPFTGSR